MSETKTQTRIAWVDLLETISIVMVVLYHCTAYIGGNDLATAGVSFYVYYFLRSILAVCVPLFFFINGYILFRQEFRFKKHLKRIFKFIFIAIFWYILTLVVMLLFRREQVGVNGLLPTIVSLKSGINHLWYLGALVCLYLIFPILKVVYDCNRRVFCYFVAVCLILTVGNSLLNELSTIISTLLGQQSIFTEINFFSIFNPLRGVYAFSFMYFCLGGLAHICWDKIQTIVYKYRQLAIAGIIVGWLGMFGFGVFYSQLNHQVWDNVWYGYDTLWVLCAATGIFLLSLKYTRRNCLFETVSRNTLGVYLIHMVIIFCVGEFIGGIIRYLSPLNSGVSLGIMLIGNIAYAAAIFIISLLLSISLLRIPLIRRLVS